MREITGADVFVFDYPGPPAVVDVEEIIGGRVYGDEMNNWFSAHEELS